MSKKTETKNTSQSSGTPTTSKKSWDRVGSILQSKKGGFYLKIEDGVELKAGDIALLRKPADEVQALVDRNVITQEVADERLAKIPDFVKYNLVRPPSDDSNF